ncbi:hypothetical protein Pla100_31400 [Neorhodopirellula pilleata]|uniref:Uncharacterized protein n=2 Tax=Neorhodopirellula pilleata TaxID=2714738 RepID=A0A5C6A7K3_9BACT|nr:hypothetical protein Pla100_31400 [Neorhodopirellula pilleata]
MTGLDEALGVATTRFKAQFTVFCLVNLVPPFDSFDIHERLREFLAFAEIVASKYPQIWSDFLKRLPDDPTASEPSVVDSVGSSTSEADDSPPITSENRSNPPKWQSDSLSNIERIQAFLKENPWKTAKEIAQATGISSASIGAQLHVKKKGGRFTSKPDPNGSVRGRVWANGKPGQVSVVGSSTCEFPEERVTTTGLVFNWLREHGSGTAAEIADAIKDKANSDAPDFTSVVRTLVSRAAQSGELSRDASDGVTVFSIADHKEEVDVPEAYQKLSTFNALVAWVEDQSIDLFTLSDAMKGTGKNMESIRTAIYTKEREHFEVHSKKGPNKQSLFRYIGRSPETHSIGKVRKFGPRQENKERESTIEEICEFFTKNQNEFTTTHDIATEIGRPLGTVQHVIYIKHKDFFERSDRKGRRGQSLYRLKLEHEGR